MKNTQTFLEKQTEICYILNKHPKLLGLSWERWEVLSLSHFGTYSLLCSCWSEQGEGVELLSRVPENTPACFLQQSALQKSWFYSSNHSCLLFSVKLGSHPLFSWLICHLLITVSLQLSRCPLCAMTWDLQDTLWSTAQENLDFYCFFSMQHFSSPSETLIIHFIVLFFQHVKWVLQWFESIVKSNCICFEQVQMNTQALVNQSGANKIIGKVILLRNCLILSTAATAKFQLDTNCIYCWDVWV